MLKKRKLLSVLAITPLFISTAFISCSSIEKNSGIDKNGKLIPLNASQINDYLEFKINEEAVENTTASVALKSINHADREHKLYFLRSFLIPLNETIPKNFTYDVIAIPNKNDPNSIIVEITSTDKVNSAKSIKSIQIDNFKPEIKISDEDYKKLYDNLLEAADLKFLISGIEDNQLKASDIKNRNNHIRWTSSILAKYDQWVFEDEPFANMYYASHYNSGGNSKEALDKAKNKDYFLIIQENKAKEEKAIEQTKELLYKKEIQPIKNSITGKEEKGYSDNDYVRKVIQKLATFAAALTTNLSDNKWYNNEHLKKTIKDILDDFSEKYFYEKQQQYVNWWHYEIGIPKDLTKVLSILYDVYSKEDFQRWTKAIKYFLPNVRYGGAAPTAIHSYQPVTKKRLQTGANIIDNVKPVLINAILEKDQPVIEDAILGMYDTVFREFVNHGDGFYLDGSFLQHENTPYVGSYGEVLFLGMADIFEYLKGTKLSIAKDPRFNRIYKFIELSIMPFMFKMSIQDGMSGRSITREGHSDKGKGINILGALTIFLKEAPEEYKSRLYNFIWDQVNGLTDEEFINLAKKNKVRDSFINALIKIKNSNKMQVNERNIDWQYYETNYFNKNNEPSSVTPLTKNKKTVFGGVDLAKENDGITFTKNQDRYVWNKKDWMLNINLRGRITGFAEATLGENLESYYQFDGATLLHTSENNDPYGNEYWTTVNYNEIPGTSSIKNSIFDPIYKYRLPKDKLLKDYNEEELLSYNAFIKQLKDKQQQIEKTISLKTNKTFANGIIFENSGMVKSQVLNYDRTLRTTKTYLMIDDMLIIVGNVNKKRDTINTTIENRMNPLAIKNSNGEWENLDDQTFDKQKLGEKDFFIFNNKNNKEKNGYVILGSNKAISSKNNIEKYPRIAADGRNKVTDRLITRSFDKLSFNHKTNNSFAYAIIPNYDKAKENYYKNNIDNIEVIKNNSNYIIIKYRKRVGDTFENFYYVNSFFEQRANLIKYDQEKNIIESDKEYDQLVREGIFIPELDFNLKVSTPTSMVIKQIEGFKDLSIISSSDLNQKSYSFSIDKYYSNIESKIITNSQIIVPKIENKPEVKITKGLGKTLITVNNHLGQYNDYNHNVWMKLSDYDDEN